MTLNLLFDPFWNSHVLSLPRPLSVENEKDFDLQHRTPFPRILPLDLVEKPEAYTLTADVPGVPADKLKVEVADGVLTISGDRSHEEKTISTDQLCHQVKRRFDQFHQSLRLPRNTNIDEITAKLQHGVVSITLPKQAQECIQSKRIPIAAA